MKTTTHFAIALLAVAGIARASDRIGVYALIDKVVLEPNADAPERIQVWGVFALADKSDRDAYQVPVRGYMYFTVSGNQSGQQMARREWADLKSVAGQRKVIGFGARYRMNWRVRTSNERPEKPDEYQTDSGVTLVRPNTEYSPIKALLDFKDR